ncbi:PAS domain S-box protein [Chloroflexota bacterium]
MSQQKWGQKLATKLRGRHPWIVLLLLFLITIPQYFEQLGILGISSFNWAIDVDRYAFIRIFYLLPIIYAYFTLGFVAGIATTVVSMLCMLPRAIILSPATLHASLETILVTFSGLLSCFHLETQKKARLQKDTDVKRLKQAQDKLEKNIQLLKRDRERLNALNTLSGIITQSLEVEDVLSSAIEKVAEIMDVEIVLIFLVNQETLELDHIAHKGVSRDFISAIDKIRVGEGFNGGVAATGKAIIVKDASSDPRLCREEVVNEGIYAQLIVPLRFKGVVTGTLCAATRQPRQFQTEEIDLLSTIGNAIGVALENARLYTEQKQLAADLKISERNYRILFESANDAIYVHDQDGNTIAANQAAAKLTGYSVKELSQMNVRSFLSKESLTLAKQVGQHLRRSEDLKQPYKQRVLRRDGAERTLMLSTSMIDIDNNHNVFYNIARDVTEEQLMRENTRFYLQQVVQAQEEERKRIARELHDDTTQLLVSLSRQLDNVIRKKSHLPKDDMFALKDLQVQLNRAIRSVHRFSQDLRPSLLDDLGLIPAFRSLTRSVKEYDMINTELEVTGNEKRFLPEVEIQLFRIVQEALSNIRKHSGASEARLLLDFTEDSVKIVIVDNGCGFEVPERVDGLPRSGKLGLAGIQERVQLLGGTLEIESAPGKGTTIKVKVKTQNHRLQNQLD